MIFPFKNYVEKIGNFNSDTAILMFHGFPAEPIKSLETEKNIDFGKFMSKNLEIDVFIHHYSGLGRSVEKIFSFNSSVIDSIELYDELKKIYKNVWVIGHSWGGFVALNLCQMRSVDRLFLQSPFWKIPSREILSPVLESLFSIIPYVKRERPIDYFLNEFYEFEKLDILNLKANEILILHPESDDEVPFSGSVELQKMNTKIKLKSIDTDHGFWLNRELLFEEAKIFFS